MAVQQGERFTIDGLSEAAGVKVSTIRMYQHRRLLPGPEIEGRVGYYGQTHLQRLRLIARLQDEGYSLASIVRLVHAWDTGRGLIDLLASDEPVTVSRTEFGSLFPAIAANEELLQRLQALGALSQRDDHLELADDRLLRIGTALADTGIDLTAVITEAEHTARVTDDLADRFVQLFKEHVWEPYVESGLSAEQLPTIIEQLNQIQPLAIEAVAASMRNSLIRASEQAMRAAVEGFANPALGDSGPSDGVSDLE
jgi:DNA-binding transcriptional MerR regulator